MGSASSNSTMRSKAFEKEVLEHLDLLYSVALRLTRNPEDAQDLLQDALVKALRFHARFKPGTFMKAWLLTVLRNTFINEYRKNVRRAALLEWNGMEELRSIVADRTLGYYPKDLRDKDVLELLDDEVRDAVESLPEGHRRAVIMADLQDMSYQEIADALECPIGTVMSRLHRGRRLLRRSLEGLRPQLTFG